MKRFRAQTVFFVFLLIIIGGYVMLQGCGNGAAGGGRWDEPVLVKSTDPANGEIGVPTGSLLTATFSQAMDPTSLTAATFLLRQGATPVAGTVTYSGVTATFNPTSDLLPSTLYTATITTGARDLAGHELSDAYVWTFTTGTNPDTTAPTVTSTVPANGAVGVPIGNQLSATFSEAMNPGTLTAATFTLQQGATPVAGAVIYSGVTATFTPGANLLPGTLYTATITTGARDLANNALASNHVWTFTTGATPDLTIPTVTDTINENGATGVAINTKVGATFSEAMDPLTLTTITFSLRQGTTAVAGTVDYSGVSAVFTPNGGLAPNTLYTATITTGAKDLAGNVLSGNQGIFPAPSNYVWSFTTGSTGDSTRPTVTSTVPTNGAVGVPLGNLLTATFSEAMDPLTITNLTFTLRRGATVVSGTVSYAGVTATFDPSADLLPNTLYTATITTGAKDLAGNALAGNYVWTFTTAAALDTTRPSVISTVPLDTATSVPIGNKLTATFSEPMDPLTINTATFILKRGLTVVAGTVIYSGVTATFTPTGGLLAGTFYNATITTGAKDLAGNALANDFNWEFTTGAALDTAGPTVTLAAPANLATGVALNSTVNATFSEVMDPLTINNLTFSVAGITGQVLYDPITRIATFTPDLPLAPGTTYTATVSTGAEDLAGNPLVPGLIPNPWTFSTGTGLAPGAINLRSLSTFVAVAGAGLTNSNSGGITTLNGDVGLSPTGTCIGDGSPCSALNPLINGTLYANDPGGIAAQAKTDLIAAYVDGSTRPPGTTVNDISGMVLPPGVYTSGSTMSIAVGGTLTLDGQGDANAVWIFQVGSSLTVNNSAQVLLINGAKAKNVFWAIAASSTIGSNASFKGSVLAVESNSVGTGSVVEGRLLCTTGAITLLSNTITLPLP